MWIKGFLVPKGSEKDVVDAIRGAVDGGADWIAMWGFEACKHVSDKACGDADKVWRMMGETFRFYLKRNKSSNSPKLKMHSKKEVAV
jgi:hypothetical protein